MRRQRLTAVYVADREIDLVWEGNSTHTLYSICEVLHRNEQGMVDYYRRLYAYGWPRSKKDACTILAQIAASGVVQEYQEPRLYRRRKFLVRATGEKARAWGVNPGTVYYFIEMIDDPYKEKSYQVRTRYRGPELDQLTSGDYCSFAKVSAIAQQLDDAYWQERRGRMSKLVEIVDHRLGA